MRTWFTSIRTRLVIILIAFTLLPMALISLIFITAISRYAKESVLNTLSAITTLKENQIKNWTVDLNNNLQAELERNAETRRLNTLLKTDPNTSEFRTVHDAQLKVFESAIASHGIYEDLFLIDLSGNVVLSTNPIDEGASFASRDYFKNGLQGSYLASPSFDPSIGRISTIAAIPVRTDQGETLGVLAGRVNMDSLNKILKERTGIGDTGETYLVGANGVLLTDVRNPTIYYVAGYSKIQSEGIQHAYQDHLTGTGNYRNYQRLPVFGAYRWIPELHVGLIAEQQQSEALKTLTIVRNSAILGLIISVLLASLAAFFIGRNLARPLIELTQTAEKIAGGNLGIRANTVRNDEIGLLAIAFNSMTAQLRNLIENLEERVTTRTKQLHNRSEQLMAASEVGRTVTTILDVKELIQRVVDLIQQRFDLYYVGLFLVDENRQWAVLKAGTGLAGQNMLGRGHRLPIGETSMIGWSIANAQARIALEAGEDAVRLATPELPTTRSEAAIPLRSRGQILGALTIQSTQPGAFDKETIAVFQTMADQIAVALDNARLFVETQQTLVTVQQAYGEMSHQSWLKRARARPLSYHRDSNGLSYGTGASNGDEESSLAIPIKVRGRTVGVVKARKRENPDSNKTWSAEDVELLGTLTDQLGVALESARLFEEARRRAERERLTGEITAKVRASNDTQTIMQTAAREIRKALQVNRAQLVLQTTQIKPAEDLPPIVKSPETESSLQIGAIQSEPPNSNGKHNEQPISKPDSAQKFE